MLTPGLRLILRFFVHSLIPVSSVWLLSRLLTVYNESLHISSGLVALAAILSIPALFTFRIVLKNLRTRRAAQRMGAILPPRWDGRSFGNFDILQHTVDRFQNGYIGEGIWDKIDELGHLHSIDILWNRMYATNDADVLKTILATDFANFAKGEGLRETLNSVLGTGVFNADGDLWKFHRTMTRPYFSRDRISHFELFDAHATVAIDKMRGRFKDGHPVDFQDLINRFALDSATEFLFGTSVHSLKSELPYAHNDSVYSQFARPHDSAEKFSHAVFGVQEALAMRLRLGGIWPLQEIRRDASAEHMQVIDEFLEPILTEAIAKNRNTGVPKGAEKQDEENETLLDHLVKLTDDPVLLHDETLNILIAGRDTTASTLSLVVYMMCLYPDVFKRLRAEVLETLGSNQTPSFDDVRKMKYLRAVINETLRLYPIVPFNARVAVNDTTLPNPADPTGPRVFVPANTVVAYSVLLMQRRKDYWGPDALSFDPDRWLDERLNKYFARNPFIFIPFNAGPRICLGQQFAYNEMSFFLIRLLQNFSSLEMDLTAQPLDSRAPREWASAEGQQGKEKIIPKCLLTLFLKGGLWVRMSEE
uniref:Cytochrome P450 monooxygenase n=1 Tax=Trametes versicolor TaxID=5325 RepID=A0AA86IVZ5_TRAVE|nr:cytochrome P450 monooxygenase [Trametes versicolor]